jgi:glycyl-tRNA synthetase beta chain
MKTRSDDLADVFQRYEKMLEVSRSHKKEFIASIKVVQRISNILKGNKDVVQGWTAEKLVESQEKILAEVVVASRQHVKNAAQAGLFPKANQFFAHAFEKPVMDFFEKVMVNAEDAEVRKNRLGLLSEIRDLYTQNLADLSLLSRIDDTI